MLISSRSTTSKMSPHRRPLQPEGLELPAEGAQAQRSRQPALAQPHCSCRAARNDLLSDLPTAPADADSTTPLRCAFPVGRRAERRCVRCPCSRRAARACFAAASSRRLLANWVIWAIQGVLGLRTAQVDAVTPLRRAPLAVGARSEGRAFARARAHARAGARFRALSRY